MKKDVRYVLVVLSANDVCSCRNVLHVLQRGHISALKIIGQKILCSSQNRFFSFSSFVYDEKEREKVQHEQLMAEPLRDLSTFDVAARGRSRSECLTR